MNTSRGATWLILRFKSECQMAHVEVKIVSQWTLEEAHWKKGYLSHGHYPYLSYWKELDLLKKRLSKQFNDEASGFALVTKFFLYWETLSLLRQVNKCAAQMTLTTYDTCAKNSHERAVPRKLKMKKELPFLPFLWPRAWGIVSSWQAGGHRDLSGNRAWTNIFRTKKGKTAGGLILSSPQHASLRICFLNFLKTSSYVHCRWTAWRVPIGILISWEYPVMSFIRLCSLFL